MMSGRVYRYPEKCNVYLPTREDRLRAERRNKILTISEEWVLTDFVNRVMGLSSHGYSPVLADTKQVPPDVVIERVHHNVFNRQFEFQVFHETFEPVPEGQEIPRLYHLMTMVRGEAGQKSATYTEALAKVFSLKSNNAGLPHINPISTSERGNPMNGPGSTFTQAADIEANTPITVGGSPDRAKYIDEVKRAFPCEKFSLKMVELRDVPEKDFFYSTKYSSRPGFLLGTRRDYAKIGFSDNEVVFIKADNHDDQTLPFYCENGQLKSRYVEAGNNIVTKFSGECGVLTRDKIDNTTQWATDRGIATFFSAANTPCRTYRYTPSEAMSVEMKNPIEMKVDQQIKDAILAGLERRKGSVGLLDHGEAEVDQPAVVEEKKVKFREWL